MGNPVVRTNRFHRWTALSASIAVAVLGLGVPAHADDPLDPVLGTPGVTLPNLVPDVQDAYILRPFVMDPETETFVLGPPDLYFDTRAQNLGSVPLQLTVDDVESVETSTVSQCVSWRADHVCREQRPVGGFTWHQEHTHFHFEEFARYELRTLLRNGKVDYSSSGLLGLSEKVSFCLIDSQQVRDDAFPVAFYQTCFPTVQGISAGWTDIYDASLPGQQFHIGGLTDGRYALVISTDYGNRIYETDDSDNVVEVTIEISNGLSNVAILGRNYP